MSSRQDEFTFTKREDYERRLTDLIASGSVQSESEYENLMEEYLRFMDSDG
jgi:hypothetical protein